MKASIKRKISGLFIGLVVAILLVSLLINSQCLESFYIFHKQTSMMNVYEELNKSAKQGTLQEGSNDRLSELIEVGNISFVAMLVEEEESKFLTATTDKRRREELINQLMGYMLGASPKEGKSLKEGKNYQIYSTSDRATKEEYLEMWGSLEDGSSFILRSPIESIRESVELSNKFLLYIMSVLVLFGSVGVWYFAKRISDPILELAELSKGMANLDFDAKYVRNGADEIGVLGHNFNIMSEKLQETISELKTANYELKKDIEQKEKVEQMRNEFVANVSHELKTPIALIQGYAEGLKDGISEDAESREFYCEVIMDEAEKMNQMVKNLLTLQQAEFGKEEVIFTRFNLVELIQGIIQSRELLIQQKNAEVRFEAEGPVYVWADAFKVEQVVQNYLNNGLNHVSGDHIIDIKILPIKGQDKVRVSVFNTGEQIPEDAIERIWEKFYKVDKARTREYGGNGIGLSIVKAIMESFHQDYGVKNYSNGVAFWFELDTK